MDTPLTDQLAKDIIQHRPGAIKALIEHARNLESTVPAPQTASVEPMTTAQEAEYLIHGPRRDDYGPVTKGFEHVARLWAPILGLAAVTPRQVAACMVAWKMSRALTGSSKHDNFVDMVGYALLWEQVEDEEAGR